MQRRMLGAAIGVGLVLGSGAALAQGIGGTNGDSFLTAVRETDGNKATTLLDGNGSTVINYRGAKGETALNIVARRRDSTWLGFLVGRGADVNAGDDRGETPLLIAARLGWLEGAQLLLRLGAVPDRDNRLGETPLIVAVQARQAAVVRSLLESGANPDKRDAAAGLSAREYAKRDSRSGELTRLIDSVKPAKKSIAGPLIR